ncbi:MAG: DNA repair ATPase, partial [Bacteroidota bacterium]
RIQGVYLLLNYNLIAQRAENPIVCHGFTIFDNGEMCLFKTDEEPKRHHAIQIWQTPFTGPNFQIEEKGSSELRKIGNKEIVRAMAESQEVINLITRNEVYADLYIDIIKKSTDILDSYYWLSANEHYDLKSPLTDIRTNAESAVDEFEKVRKIKENSGQTLKTLEKKKEKVLKKAKGSFNSIELYVELLGEIRSIRGEIITAKELRYIDVNALDLYDNELAESSDTVSTSCIRFLTQDHALEPFRTKVSEFEAGIDKIKKVVEADELTEKGEAIADELNLLIDTISNLKITDATQTTKIIENISAIYGQYNQVKGGLITKRKSLLSDEAKLEFEATMRLLEQSVSNYIDISETPEQCDDFMTKVVLQVEELEAKFSDFDDFLTLIEQKREEVYNAFESKKLYLTEQRNKKSNQLFQAAERVLNAIRNKSRTLSGKDGVNAYFASDLMVTRIRDISKQLVEQGDVVKSDDLTSQLKTIKEDTLRQLRDKEDLFTEGENIIKLGNHQFYANKLDLELSIVNRNDRLCYHLSGTDFFEPIEDITVAELKDLWDQSVVSENDEVYRGEYLAHSLYVALNNATYHAEDDQISLDQYLKLDEKGQLEVVRAFMMNRYQEGYLKGIHEMDAYKILQKLVETGQAAGVLRFSSKVRAFAAFMWNSCFDDDKKKLLHSQMKAASLILSVFPGSRDFDGIINDIKQEIEANADKAYASEVDHEVAAEYLFEELSLNDHFSVSIEASDCYHSFTDKLGKKRATTKFQKSVDELKDEPGLAMRLIKNWVHAFLEEQEKLEYLDVIDEVSVLLYYKDFSENRVKQVSLTSEIEGLNGAHSLIEEGKYDFHLNHFLVKLENYKSNVANRFEALQALKKNLAEDYKEDLKLNEFKPRVLSSFVRNRLIDEVYFPLIGANLAKQMGAAGDNKRTDLMGLLLLISPPGYGKTTLMEYIASRLGIIFMKINGPAIGHEVTSLDPQDAPNAASAQELQKLNFSFEMGNNVMIYLDDIQHCNPEFLQKFISMCDAQRKIEGVYKGKTKTYDFRGKKVCVVMAGNPYTESGDKFQIPDMLSN